MDIVKVREGTERSQTMATGMVSREVHDAWVKRCAEFLEKLKKQAEILKEKDAEIGRLKTENEQFTAAQVAPTSEEEMPPSFEEEEPPPVAPAT